MTALPERPCPQATSQGAKSVLVGDRRSPRRATVHADADTVVIRGRGVRDVLRRASMKPLYAGTIQGWMLDRRRLDDALAALDRAGYAVMLEDAAPTTSARPRPMSGSRTEQTQELGLW
jgi:hypothetical protein